MTGVDNQESVPKILTETYQKDLNMVKLKNQIAMLPDLGMLAKQEPAFVGLKKVSSLRTLTDIMCAVSVAKKMFSEVDQRLRIFLTLPLTTSSAERSFSTLR